MSERGQLEPDRFVDPVAWDRQQRLNYSTSLKVWWSRDYGYLTLLDPFSGQVYDVAYEEAPKWFVYRAFDEKRRRQGAQGVNHGA